MDTEEEQQQGWRLPGMTGSVVRTKAEAPLPQEKEPKEAVVAAGALASSAVIAEAVQIGGTAVLFAIGQNFAGTDSPVETVSALIDYIQSLGVAGYGVFAAAMIFLQVVPIAAAFVLTVSAGAMFGAVKGTAIVLTCSTISATISFFIARNIGRAGLLDAAKDSKQFIAIDKAFGEASFGSSLTLITLLRLSPVLPFAWANYIFGLSPVPAAAFSIGTFVGCLPAVTAYVSAGQVGADVVIQGAETDPIVLALGAVATIGAITLAGSTATNALKDLDLDLMDGWTADLGSAAKPLPEGDSAKPRAFRPCSKAS
eukprot:CAMPEP_0115857990 /NCGR_PEP_ID=MMETSP0287-20121206/15862_1 /TAXON_ID=412157 /ORGANISM="Chrysochromulina rotalis, Strain UIO044" /LENGTH=312 /DNA_ID=CAMNT_0003312231 /DNA_START=161 /DNA_END=1100 /DNA_ORIENTATION=+